MLEIPETTLFASYKIKLIIAVEKDFIMNTKNEFVSPEIFQSLEESQKSIEMDIECRIKNGLYFRSQKPGYDLVRYSQTATLNTYIAYRVLPCKTARIL